MLKNESDFIVASEITCVAKNVEVPELMASGECCRASEARKLQDLLNDRK